MKLFEQLVADKKAFGRKQIVIRSSEDLAWKSGFATYLMANYQTRKLGFCDDFIAYI